MHALNQNILTSGRLDEIRAQVMAFAENPLCHRHSRSPMATNSLGSGICFQEYQIA